LVLTRFGRLYPFGPLAFPVRLAPLIRRLACFGFHAALVGFPCLTFGTRGVLVGNVLGRFCREPLAFLLRRFPSGLVCRLTLGNGIRGILGSGLSSRRKTLRLPLGCLLRRERFPFGRFLGQPLRLGTLFLCGLLLGL